MPQIVETNLANSRLLQDRNEISMIEVVGIEDRSVGGWKDRVGRNVGRIALSRTFQSGCSGLKKSAAQLSGHINPPGLLALGAGVLPTDVVVLDQNIPIGVSVTLPKLDVTPLQRNQFTPPQPSSDRQQKQVVVFGADSLSSRKELLNFFRSERNTFQHGILSRSGELAEIRGGVCFEDTVFNPLVENTAQDADSVSDSAPRQSLGYQLGDEFLDVITPDLVQAH